MASYRFCRPDDIPQLIEAFNDLYRPYFASPHSLNPESLPWDLNLFKQAMHEYELWAGYSMLALHGTQKIGVLSCLKREDAIFIYRIAIHPGHLRQGHGSHLLQSIQQKTAILAPGIPLRAEAFDTPSTVSFFNKNGYELVSIYTDFSLGICRESLKTAIQSTSLPSELSKYIVPIHVSDVVEESFFQRAAKLSFLRQARTLQRQARHLKGYGISGPDGFLAYAFTLERPSFQRTEILGFGCHPSFKIETAVLCLLSHIEQSLPLTHALSFPRLSDSEIPFSFLTSLGFQRGASFHGMLHKHFLKSTSEVHVHG